jgi:predicted phosphoribosyltransferase/pimeloyl-ACP methyl ester carboxylesterase
MSLATIADPIPVIIGPNRLAGLLAVPEEAIGLVIFAHGSGSGRFSPRNNQVARKLQEAGLATLLPDLLKEGEERDRRNVFDIPLLAERLKEVTDWADALPATTGLPIGYFGASTGAGAALLAASQFNGRVGAVVSRGGRPDLAMAALPYVHAPTLLLVGSLDTQVLDLNRAALAQLRCDKKLVVILGASHLFEEAGTLDQVVSEASHWFSDHLRAVGQAIHLPFSDRRAAGRLLGEALARFKGEHPLILALPRGGVPVAFEVAKALDGDLDLLLVRKLGAPGHEEFGIGAIVDGESPQIVLNDEAMRLLRLPASYVEREAGRQLAELERRRYEYLEGRSPMAAQNRTVIVVDDGIATGGTVRAALRGIRSKQPRKLILAIPIAPSDTLATLGDECDEIVCLATPDPFHAVGIHYADFNQTTDAEVKQLLGAARNVESTAPI